MTECYSDLESNYCIKPSRKPKTKISAKYCTQKSPFYYLSVIDTLKKIPAVSFHLELLLSLQLYAS